MDRYALLIKRYIIQIQGDSKLRHSLSGEIEALSEYENIWKLCYKIPIWQT